MQKIPNISVQQLQELYDQAVQFQENGQTELAETIYRRILLYTPLDHKVLCNLGALYRRTNRIVEAIDSFKKALSVKPNEFFVLANLGIVFEEQRNLDEAYGYYKRALAAETSDAPLLIRMGNVCREMGKYSEAASYYQSALRINPNNKKLYKFLGSDLSAIGKKREAGYYLKKYIQMFPDEANDIFPFMARVYLEGCNWDVFSVKDFAEGYSESILQHGTNSLWDFIVLPLDLSSQEQQSYAMATAQMTKDRISGIRDIQNFIHKPSRLKKKIKIGYVSSDFWNHATVFLMRGVFKRHDREKFEIYIYSNSRDDQSACRHRVMEDCDQFIDITNMNLADTAQRIYSDGIDILIDLKGYTGGHRLGVFALRPAPIQVTYLGYPGTLGADFIDYNIVDRVVVPEEQEKSYSEKLVYMPDSYQVNDRERPVAERIPTRKECNLPEEAFVFCCFNASYKIEPTIFSVWMRILKKTPGSVLWVLGKSADVEQNLTREAEARGVSGDRLIFADVWANERHLVRHKLADLFLDTYYVNAHTTASDALWTGLPVLTCPGETFASRVSMSLLYAVGLPELITSDFKAYEDKAVYLATHQQELQRLKDKLENNRLTCSLFDTDKFVRDLEQAYQTMWNIYISGDSPRRVEVVSTLP